MPQQNLTLKINVDAATAADRIQQITANMKQLGMNFSTVKFNVNEAGQSMDKLTKQSVTTGQSIQNLGHQVKTTGQNLLSMNLAANAITGAFRMLVSHWRHALDVNLELNAAQRLLNASTQDGAAAFDWVKHKAFEYGLAVSQLAHDYGIFIASAKDSSLAINEQNYIFESVTQAVSALGMSTEESGRVFLALREMLAKNVLTSQELVRQWGNVLPNAVGRAAKAFGKTQEEFKKALHTGSIRGKELNKWLMEYSRLLREDFGGAAIEGANALQGSLNKMRDALELLYYEVGKGEGFPALNEAIRDLAEELRKPATLASLRQMGDGIARIVQLAGGGVKFLWEYRQVIIALGVAMKATSFTPWIKDFALMTKAKWDGIRASWAEEAQARVKAVTQAKEIATTQVLTNQITKETITRNQARLAKMMESIASGRVVTVATLEYMARLRKNALIDQETIKLNLAIVAKRAWIAVSNLAGSALGVLNLTIMAAAAAWGFYAKKQSEAKAKMEEARITIKEKNSAYTDMLMNLQNEIKLLNALKPETKEYNTQLIKIKESIRAWNEANKELQINLETEGKTVKQLTAEWRLLNNAQLENLELSWAEKANEARKVKGEIDKLNTEYEKLNKLFYDTTDPDAKMSLNFKLGNISSKLEKMKEQYKEVKKEATNFNDIIERHKNKQTISESEDNSESGNNNSGSHSADKLISRARLQIEINKHILGRRELEKDITDEKNQQAEYEKAMYDYDTELQKIENARFEALTGINERLANNSITSADAEILRYQIAENYRVSNEQAEKKHQNTMRNFAKQSIQDYEDNLRRREDAEKTFVEEATIAEKHGLDKRLALVDKWAEEAKEKLRKAGIGITKELQDMLNIAVESRKSEEILKDFDLKKQITALTKLKGGLSNLDYENVFTKARERVKELTKDMGENNEAIQKLESRIQELKDELHFNGKWYEGLGYGLREYLASISNHFQNFSNTMVSIGQGFESQMSNLFENIFEKGMTGSEKWKLVWQGLTSTVIKSLATLAAKELTYMVFHRFFSNNINKDNKAEIASDTEKTAVKIANLGALTTAELTASATKIIATKLEEAADSMSMAAKVTKSYAGLGPPGVAAATAEIAEYIAIIKAAGKSVAFAKGGLVTKPTLALIGETGKREFVAPEIDFFDWSERLACNIMRRQDEANSYKDYTANIIQAVDAGGMKEPVINNYYNVTGKREMAAFFSGMVDYHKARV
jgi:tape measure domain-containing protein